MNFMARACEYSFIAALTSLCLCVSVARADDVEADIQLMFSVDVSFSIDRNEQRQQREGYAAALEDPRIVAALTAGPIGRAAIAYVEWADAGYQRLVAPWTLIEQEGDAAGFAALLREAPIRRNGATSISSALLFSAAQFEGNGISSPRKVIDISGDGLNSEGPRTDLVRDALVARGFTINGLPLDLEETDESADVAAYYEACVIGGPGAFYVPVRSWEAFADAIRRKVVLELAGAAMRPALVVLAASPPPVDCVSGERQARERYLRRLDEMTNGRPQRWIPPEEVWPTPE